MRSNPMARLVVYAQDGHEWVANMMAILVGAAVLLFLMGVSAFAQEPGVVVAMPCPAASPGDTLNEWLSLAEHVGIVLAGIGASCSLAASKVNAMVRGITAAGGTVPPRALTAFALLNVFGGNLDKASQFYAMANGLPVPQTATPSSGTAPVAPAPEA